MYLNKHRTMQTSTVLCLFIFQKSQRTNVFPFPTYSKFLPTLYYNAHSYQDLFMVTLHPSFISPLFLATYILHLHLRIFSLPFSVLIHALEKWPLQTGHSGSSVLYIWIDFANGSHGQEIRIQEGEETMRICSIIQLSSLHRCGCISAPSSLEPLSHGSSFLWILATPLPSFAPSGLELITVF